MPALTPPSSNVSVNVHVDIDDSRQNAFVQDWLLAWARAHTIYGSDNWSVAAVIKSATLRNTPYARSENDLIADAHTFEGVIEHIQGTYGCPDD